MPKRPTRFYLLKVEADGFDLGTQRRPIDRNDLPNILNALLAWHKAVLDGNTVLFHTAMVSALLVPTTQLAENDYNLSADRYREVERNHHKDFPMVSIGEICEIVSGVGFPVERQGLLDQEIPFLKVSDMNLPGNETEIRFWNNTVSPKTAKELRGHICPPGTIIFPKIGAAIATNKKRILTKPSLFDNNVMGIIPSKKIEGRYLYNILLHFDLSKWASSSQPPSMRKSDVEKETIPVPPLKTQCQIVDEIAAYKRIIDGARQVVQGWKPNLEISPEWDVVKISDICQFVQYGLSGKMNTDGKGYKTFRMNELINGFAVDNGEMKYSDISEKEFLKYKLNKGDLLFNRTNSIEHVGRTGIFMLDGDYCFASYLIRLTIKDNIDPSYINLYMNTTTFQTGIKQFATRAIGQANINATSLQAYKIPLPPLKVQREIVSRVEVEQAIVDGNRRLIMLYEEKIKKVVTRVWEG